MVGSASAAGLSETQTALFRISKLLVVVLKMTKPVAGVVMAFLSVVVILGGYNLFEVLLKSNRADAAGVAVPIPTFCAMLAVVMAKKTKIANAFFMIFC
jgi:hypothetical protein